MQAGEMPSGRFFNVSQALPETLPPAKPGPELAPAPPEKKGKGFGPWFIVTALVAGGALGWVATRSSSSPAPIAAALRTVAARPGVLEKTLRVGGTITAKNYVAIRAPRMRGPRDTGRTSLTLMNLAGAGAIVPAGAIVAEFELKWLEDHIDDRRSAMVQAEADVEKRRADLMVLRETDRQQTETAKGEYGKAELDLRTAEVRSQIQAEILKLSVQETKVTWEQLQQQLKLTKSAHQSDLAAMKITVDEARLHLERHLRDHEKMRVKTPIGGLIVMEPMYKGGGQFQQTETGDQVYPGALFMRVVDLSDMVVSASVNQVDVQLIKLGQEATVRLDAYPDLVLKGKVVGIGAIAAAGGGGGHFRRGGSGNYVKQIAVQIAIHAEDERIIPDLSASADIRLETREADLLLPREAVRYADGAAVVYVRSGAGFEPRTVELGEKSDTHVIIRAGLIEGEEVLLDELPAKS